MARKFDRKIVLENGDEYKGFGFGDDCDKVCNLVFNTSMVGYQEMVSDPANTGNMIVMTYPVIGSYGIADDDFESKGSTIGGLIVREYNDSPSNFRCTKTLSEILEENHIPAISGLDTRKLTKTIRDQGNMKVLITDINKTREEALEILQNTPLSQNLVSAVSSKKKWYSRTSNHEFNVVAIDCGIKLSVIRILKKNYCNVSVVPYDVTAKEIIAMEPDGIIITSGPGNPLAAEPVIQLVKELKGKYPIFGISLGNLIIGLAYGAEVKPLKFGHRGSAPVKEIESGKIMTTSQGQGFVIKKESVENTDLTVTHINVAEGTVEGVECKKDRIFGVQFHPESAPGPQDSEYLFDKFIELMREVKENA